jgi:hypothetical protein
MAMSLDDTVADVSVGAVAQGESEFLKFLDGRHLKEGSKARHKGRRAEIVRCAIRIGLLKAPAIELEWEVAAKYARQEKGGASNIVKYAVTNGIHTAEFSQRHVNAWKVQALDDGYSPTCVNISEKAFRRALRIGKLELSFPKFNTSKRVEPFSLFLEDMPPLLRADVQGILNAMQEKAEAGTVCIGDNLLSQFEAICGYAFNELGRTDIESVDPLLTEDFLRGYVNWKQDTKKCKRPAISNKLGGLHTVVCTLDRFTVKDFSFWPTLLNNVQPEPQSSVKARRRTRGLPFRKLLTVISGTRKDRLSANDLSPKEFAWSLHDQLLMKVAIMLAWDSSLIRVCRISGPSKNLLKIPAPKDRAFLAFTPAAIEAREKDESVRLWQFNFEEQWGIGAYGFLICQVVPLLQEYLAHRWRLVNKLKGDPRTLFLRRDGAALTKSSLARLVRDLTHKYAKKSVTPESIRNSFIDYWLLEHPKDYINLANILMISLESVQVRFDPDYKRTLNRGR